MTHANFGSVRRLLALKQIAVASAAGLNYSRLSSLEVGYRDPTSREDSALRRVLLRVAERRRQELEAAIAWLRSADPQTWDANPGDALARVLVGGPESPADPG
jgi:hypothetical protein